MIDPKIIDDMAHKLAGLIPQGARDVQQDLKKNVKAVLQAKLSKLDLVTREEFDTQAAVLQRTREKLDALEKQVLALEKGSEGKTGKS